jgi:ABC-type branched-subunit amino acid transport system ATPase component
VASGEAKQLVKYQIDGLFGRPPIPIDLAEEGVSLLTGANGTGKSTVLKSIDAVANARWLGLHALPFRSVAFEFADGTRLDVARDDTALHVLLDQDQFIEFAPDDIPPVDLDEATVARTRGVRRVSPFRYEFEGREYTRRDLELFLGLRLFLERADAMWLAEIPEWFRARLIPDQRLVLQSETARTGIQRTQRALPVRYAVDQYARALATEIGRGLSEYGLRSQDVDRVFPQRVLGAMGESAPVPTSEEVRDVLAEVANKRRALQGVGLLQSHYEAQLPSAERLDDDRIRQVMHVFARDLLEKYAILEDLRRRLEGFAGFLNSRYEGKQLVVDRALGFSMLMSDGTRVRPSDLSSGEQQLLVMAYNLLFEAEPSTLMLIDEPELSLHVLWQANLVEDLMEMGRASNLTFLLASHSPSLIGDREELIRSLDL